MADIIKIDVRTYVRELIAKEFGTHAYTEKVLSDNLKRLRVNPAMGNSNSFTINR